VLAAHAIVVAQAPGEVVLGQREPRRVQVQLPGVMEQVGGADFSRTRCQLGRVGARISSRLSATWRTLASSETRTNWRSQGSARSR
jgi:hypothetical protein